MRLAGARAHDGKRRGNVHGDSASDDRARGDGGDPFGPGRSRARSRIGLADSPDGPLSARRVAPARHRMGVGLDTGEAQSPLRAGLDEPRRGIPHAASGAPIDLRERERQGRRARSLADDGFQAGPSPWATEAIGDRPARLETGPGGPPVGGGGAGAGSRPRPVESLDRWRIVGRQAFHGVVSPRRRVNRSGRRGNPLPGEGLRCRRGGRTGRLETGVLPRTGAGRERPRARGSGTSRIRERARGFDGTRHPQSPACCGGAARSKRSWRRAWGGALPEPVGPPSAGRR